MAITSETEILLALDRAHVWHPFTQAQTAPDPVAIASGRGAVLATADGEEILDCISSWWVNLHGHAHPKIVAALARQAARLEHAIFADFTHEPAVTLAHRLSRILPAGLSRVFFSDNGSTAVEVALKLALQYWHNRGDGGRTRILAFEGGYHGDTFGAMSAGASSGFYEPFRRHLFPVDPIPFPATWDGDLEVEDKEAAALSALDRWLDRHAETAAAMILEPLVQGAAGMRMCRPMFLGRVAARLKSAGVLLVADEVMTGFCRTGTRFACEQAGIEPDLICLSKGLTGGFLPMAVTVATEAVYRAFAGDSFGRAFAHGHSFTANPLGCAVALASLDLLLEPDCQARVAAIEAAHRAFLAGLDPACGLVRGRVAGTILAVEVDGLDPAYAGAAAARLNQSFYRRGFLIRPIGRVLYLMPPYCIEAAQLTSAHAALIQGAREIAEEPK